MGDGKAKSFGVFVSKIKTYAQFDAVGDAWDLVLIKSCPTHSEFVELNITSPDNQTLVFCIRQTRNCVQSLHWVRVRATARNF